MPLIHGITLVTALSSRSLLKRAKNPTNMYGQQCVVYSVSSNQKCIGEAMQF